MQAYLTQDGIFLCATVCNS